MRVEYSSNNSGGDWWLEDEDWFALEKAGWKISWIKDNSDYDKHERWLGALATSAIREGLHLEEAIDEWENITKQNSYSQGCPCCGRPHNFTEYDDNDEYVDSN